MNRGNYIAAAVAGVALVLSTGAHAESFFQAEIGLGVSQTKDPIINEYSYIEGLPNWQAQMLNCEIPDSYLDGLKAIQEQAVIAPLVKTIIGR